MAAVPVVNNLLAQRPFFMIKIHRQNLNRHSLSSAAPS